MTDRDEIIATISFAAFSAFPISPPDPLTIGHIFWFGSHTFIRCCTFLADVILHWGTDLPEGCTFVHANESMYSQAKSRQTIKSISVLHHNHHILKNKYCVTYFPIWFPKDSNLLQSCIPALLLHTSRCFHLGPCRHSTSDPILL